MGWVYFFWEREWIYWRVPERSVWINAFAPQGQKTLSQHEHHRLKVLLPLTLHVNSMSHKKKSPYAKDNSYSTCLCCHNTGQGGSLPVQKTTQGLLGCAHEIISAPKPRSLFYQDQVLWFNAKYQSWWKQDVVTSSHWTQLLTNLI